MATAPPPRQPTVEGSASARPAARSARGTDHLKQVPTEAAVRRRIRAEAIQAACAWDKSQPLGRPEMETRARALLAELQLPEAYVGWTMVALAAAFWRDHVAAVPCQRRLLLLPHCLRSAKACRAEYNELGLLCQDCGACSLTDLRAFGQRHGYKVMIAEGSPAVMQIILGGHVDAILGVACLDALEKTLDKILLAGIPCLAVPLLVNGCCNTSSEEDWVREMILTPYRPGALHTRTYLHLMRCAAQMFERPELDRLVPPGHGRPLPAQPSPDDSLCGDPMASTEAIAYDFLASGGKHSRPFITLAAYDALTGGRGTLADGARHLAALPDAVKRIALAIEIFHKASLVHDDIEDDDPLRYGRPTLHRRHGTPVAINVGDYLIGLGYRLLSEQREALGAELVADILARLTHAHTRLCQGQGAELAWRSARDRPLAPLDVLKIYAMKTAPAFEAALYAGIRLAGPADAYREPAARFARHLGVAYQILDDLEDWETGDQNHRPPGTDLLSGRPTVLSALAMQSLNEADRRRLRSLLGGSPPDQQPPGGVGELYERAGVYATASTLVSRHRQRALAVAEQVQPEPLRRLLELLVDVILGRGKYEG